MNERDNLTNIAQVLEEIAHFSEAQTLPLNHDPVKKNTISHLHLSVLFFLISPCCFVLHHSISAGALFRLQPSN